MEGTDDEAYWGAVPVLAAVTRTIQACYTDIDDSRIVGHSDIAPDRKPIPVRPLTGTDTAACWLSQENRDDIPSYYYCRIAAAGVG